MKTKNTTPVRTNNHWYVPLVVSIIPSFPVACIVIDFILAQLWIYIFLNTELHNSKYKVNIDNQMKILKSIQMSLIILVA